MYLHINDCYDVTYNIYSVLHIYIDERIVRDFILNDYILNFIFYMLSLHTHTELLKTFYEKCFKFFFCMDF